MHYILARSYQIRSNVYRYTSYRHTKPPDRNCGHLWDLQRGSAGKQPPSIRLIPLATKAHVCAKTLFFYRVSRSVRVAWHGTRGAFCMDVSTVHQNLRFPFQTHVGEPPARFIPRTFTQGHCQHFSFWLAHIGAMIFEYRRRVASPPLAAPRVGTVPRTGYVSEKTCRAAFFARCRRAVAVFPPA
jgi:hypothetical protein